MKKHIPQEETGRVLAAAIVSWAAVIGWAAIEGVLAKLAPSTLAALAVFALAYAAATYGLDQPIRRYVLGADSRLLVVASLAIDAVLVGAAIALAAQHGSWIAGLARFPFALAAFVIAPVGLALNVAAFEAASKPRVKTVSARSPGANPAAT